MMLYKFERKDTNEHAIIVIAQHKFLFSVSGKQNKLELFSAVSSKEANHLISISNHNKVLTDILYNESIIAILPRGGTLLENLVSSDCGVFDPLRIALESSRLGSSTSCLVKASMSGAWSEIATSCHNAI